MLLSLLYLQPIFGGPGSLQRQDQEAMAEIAETAELGPPPTFQQ